MNKPTRRKLLFTGAAFGAGAFAYAYSRGMRYPSPSLEPQKLITRKQFSDVGVSIKDGIFTNNDKSITLRAIAPEPSVKIEFREATELTLSINNISTNAVLEVLGKDIKLITEEIFGITRRLVLQSRKAQTLQLNWSLPDSDSFSFTVIGDSGGNDELQWAIERSKELESQFLLHLGDFNYIEGEYALAINKFKNAPMPVYVSIGNHDFHDSGLIYQDFLDNIGPMNNAFTLGGTRFINVDTAADFFPANSGHRGALFNNLASAEESFSDQLIFTHRPIKNAAPGGDVDEHVAGSQREISWLKAAIKKIDCQTFLCGHVHHSDERDIEGLQQWTVGEGLGHKDITKRKPVSKLLVGHVERGEKVRYSWQPLNMPWIYHKSLKHIKHLSDPRYKRHLDWHLKKLAEETRKATL